MFTTGITAMAKRYASCVFAKSKGLYTYIKNQIEDACASMLDKLDV